MTREQFKKFNDAASEGTISDDANPVFILSQVNSELLSQIAKGKINCQELAKRMMESRGLDINGEWIGFDKSKQHFDQLAEDGYVYAANGKKIKVSIPK